MNKSFLFTLLLLNFALSSFGQLIRGEVLDAVSGLPIDFASVYFNGTFTGTTTDEKGCFELDISKYKSRPLTISAVGYYSQALTDLDPDEDMKVRLKAKIFELEEVTVSTKSLVRKRKACMRIFKKEFIGSSSNAHRCHILNEEDISFNYQSDKDTLRVFASRPIRIRNLSLGYDISYHLDRFEYIRNSKKVMYTGNIIFERDLASDEASMMKYKRRREYAYLGSAKHFFRALWANTLDSTGFSIKDYHSGEALDYDDLVCQDYQGRKFLAYEEDLQIRYFDFFSYISFVEYQVYFGKDGYFDPTPIVWTGTISKQRIADFLPYEYLFAE